MSKSDSNSTVSSLSSSDKDYINNKIKEGKNLILSDIETKKEALHWLEFFRDQFFNAQQQISKMKDTISDMKYMVKEVQQEKDNLVTSTEIKSLAEMIKKDILKKERIVLIFRALPFINKNVSKQY